MSRLYTYLPKDNTALTEGLLSTALTDKGFEKYRGRTGKHTKEDVLKVLDSWEPEWTRSKAISALTEPIPSDAADDFLEFARNRKLYSFSIKDLIKAKILAHLRRARKGGGTDPVDDVKKERLNWHRKKKHLLFQGVPHYFVETTGGRIPPEFVREEKKASAKDIGFPKDEIEGLTGRDSIVTHRVSDDAGEYEPGDIVKSPWGDKYEVSDRKDVSKAEDSPYYKYLTDSQKALLKVYDRIAVLRLKRLEKRAVSFSGIS